MKRSEKEKVVADLKETIERSQATMVADYRGLTVAEITELRQKLKDSDGEFKVAKNTLFRFAAQGTDAQPLMEILSGPNGFAFSYGDPVQLAKVLMDFSKSNPKLELKGGVLGSSFVDAEGLKSLATLPSREVLLAKAVGALAGVMSGLVGVLSGVPRSFVGVLYAINQEKGESPA